MYCHLWVVNRFSDALICLTSYFMQNLADIYFLNSDLKKKTIQIKKKKKLRFRLGVFNENACST